MTPLLSQGQIGGRGELRRYKMRQHARLWYLSCRHLADHRQLAGHEEETSVPQVKVDAWASSRFGIRMSENTTQVPPVPRVLLAGDPAHASLIVGRDCLVR